MLLAPLGLTLSLLGAPLGGDCLVRDSDEARGDLRPALSGPVSQTLSADAVFRVHWTDSGEDAIDADRDEDANGIPDDIDRILVGLEEGLSTYEAEGWRRPRSDLGGGGTDELDVYLRDISPFGYAHVEPTSHGATCYMELLG